MLIDHDELSLVNAPLLTLTAWARSRYGDDAPGLATLRRWAREQRIFPAPEKHGRAYFVRPDAREASSMTAPELRRAIADQAMRSLPFDDRMRRHLRRVSAWMRARSRGVECMTFDDVLALWDRSAGACEVSGIRFSLERDGGRKRRWAPSIDRIDNTRGYTRDNCRLVCVAVNLALNEFGEEALTLIARGVVRRAGP